MDLEGLRLAVYDRFRADQRPLDKALFDDRAFGTTSSYEEAARSSSATTAVERV